MRLKTLHLHNFRNYEDTLVSFDEGMQIIYGRNAQGKTNLLEAIFYLSTTRSHRGGEDDDIIKDKNESAIVDGVIQKNNRHVPMRVVITHHGKNLFLYRDPVKKVSDFIGECNAVMFCPDDMSLFQASPRVRRRFVDMELSKISKSYTQTLMSAHRMLKERNVYLKQMDVKEDYLQVITEQLIEFQSIVIYERYKFLCGLLKKCRAFYQSLSLDDTQLSFQYVSCVSTFDDIDRIKDELKDKYKKNHDRDLFLKQTTSGFHKDDIVFMINGKEVAVGASQGQKRSVLLSLKIGIVNMIYDATKEYPILLLDDVFSELDSNRQEQLIQSLPKEIQIFITSTDMHEYHYQRKITCWNVEAGMIRNVKEAM